LPNSQGSSTRDQIDNTKNNFLFSECIVCKFDAI
jgi:hypothetical protein